MFVVAISIADAKNIAKVLEGEFKLKTLLEGVLKALVCVSMGQSSAHQVDHSDEDHRFAILR